MPPSGPPLPGPSPTDWMQGFGTIAGAVIALLALGAAVLAYRLQNKQLVHQQEQIADQQQLNRRQGDVLELQAEELRRSLVDRERTANRERRAQASQVFLVLEHEYRGGDIGDGVARLHNSSGQPIYDVSLRWSNVDGGDYIPPQVDTGKRSGLIPLPRLGPGEQEQWVARVFSTSFAVLDLRVAVQFRDANEVWWRIKPDGRIEEIEPPTG